MVAALVHTPVGGGAATSSPIHAVNMSAATLLCAAALGFRIQEPESGEERRLQDDSNTYSGDQNFCDSDCAQDYLPFLCTKCRTRSSECCEM